MLLLHCVAFSFLVYKGSAMEPCSKNHCSSFWSWGVYCCYYIYSVNRGTLVLKNLSPYEEKVFMECVSLRYTYLLLIDCLKFFVGLRSPKACFSRSVACPTKCNCMFILSSSVNMLHSWLSSLEFLFVFTDSLLHLLS